jgi:hypothetical protein
MNALTFEIRPSPETNDHEIRVLVDGVGVLENGQMGVDPPQFFRQFSEPQYQQLLIGRCGCGVVGCYDDIVAVEIGPSGVTWRGRNVFHFDRTHYDAAIRTASNDFSWEDSNRRAERLVGQILKGCEAEGFIFEWASARIAPKVMNLSFMKDGRQKLLQFVWDGATDASATRGAIDFRMQLNR